MTKQELNRDIKRLKKYYLNNKNNIHLGNDEYFEKEFKRLYYADKTAEYLNKESVLTLIRINLTVRFISLHLMFIQVEL